jgi:hypothetical protein
MAGSFATGFAPGWLTSVITVEPWLGTFDDYGRPLYGPAAQFDSYIEEKVRMVRDLQGDERPSNTKLYIAGGPFDPHDRITMPASFKGPSQPPVISVSNVNDRAEFSHSEVYL